MTGDNDAVDQLEFLRALLAENASIDLDVIEIREDVWVVHGLFPFEGEVEMAVFSTRAEALRVLYEACGWRPAGEI